MWLVDVSKSSKSDHFRNKKHMVLRIAHFKTQKTHIRYLQSVSMMSMYHKSDEINYCLVASWLFVPETRFNSSVNTGLINPS